MKDKEIRVDKEFDELVKKIARQKISNGTAMKLKSSRRITKAMRRHPDMPKMALDIINANLEEE